VGNVHRLLWDRDISPCSYEESPARLTRHYRANRSGVHADLVLRRHQDATAAAFRLVFILFRLLFSFGSFGTFLLLTEQWCFSSLMLLRYSDSRKVLHYPVFFYVDTPFINLTDTQRLVVSCMSVFIVVCLLLFLSRNILHRGEQPMHRGHGYFSRAPFPNHRLARAEGATIFEIRCWRIRA